MLEGTVDGDTPGALRLYEFDLRSKSYRDTIYLYALEDATHSIGDLAAINEHEYVVIERDSKVAEAARFKRIYRINISRADSRGFVAKELLVDLLDVANPARLGGFGPDFRFPFETIEGVLPINPTTLLVLNDNNYPARGGRGPEVTDPNEIILVHLTPRIALAPRADRLQCRPPTGRQSTAELPLSTSTVRQ
jgi:glycerophosphoryl diester phosphodiesterase